MAVRHDADRVLRFSNFHPESILTDTGRASAGQTLARAQQNGTDQHPTADSGNSIRRKH